MDTTHKKICTKCSKTKSLDEFARHRGGKYGRAALCKACKQAYKVAWRAANAERERLKDAAYRAKHHDKYQAWQKHYDAIHAEEKKVRSQRSYEKLKAQGLMWFQIDPERARTRNRQYYAENPEKVRAYRLANREKRLAQRIAWSIAHPERNREQCQRRRTRQAGAAIVDLSHAQWEEILAAFNYRCAYCPDDCKACKKKTHALQQEHIEPVVKSGNYTVHNIVPACEDCNRRKHTGPPLVPVQPLLLTIAPARKAKKRSG
jgi:HNH endonuclease